MARYVTRVRTRRPVAEVFAFMADLRNFALWDPGVRRVEQVAGTGGGASAVFDVTVVGVRDTTLRYRTEAYRAPEALRVVARSLLLTSTDRVTVEVAPSGGATLVTYDADLQLNGPLRLADPLLRLAFRRIGDRAAAGLRRALDGDEVPS